MEGTEQTKGFSSVLSSMLSMVKYVLFLLKEIVTMEHMESMESMEKEKFFRPPLHAGDVVVCRGSMVVLITNFCVEHGAIPSWEGQGWVLVWLQA